jgi:hypothetical protein
MRNAPVVSTKHRLSFTVEKQQGRNRLSHRTNAVQRKGLMNTSTTRYLSIIYMKTAFHSSTCDMKGNAASNNQQKDEHQAEKMTVHKQDNHQSWYHLIYYISFIDHDLQPFLRAE